MDFRIADTFSDSLARLTADEQKAVKTTAFDLQMDPANPGMQFHRIDRSKDPNFWSVRVNRDVRIVVHRTESSLMLCYVDHHDEAYRWAERRKIETHPHTGAAQLVEVRETVREIEVPRYVDALAPVPAPEVFLFKDVAESQLLRYGVPREWLPDVLGATEDSLLSLADHLPPEAAEALLELATGGTPQLAAPLPTTADPFDHPDALRRFRVMANAKELERALEFPWEKWVVFLHPAQRRLVERNYNGSARVAGSAGTGKTIVALHRAVYLAREHDDSRVLLATFSETLANALRGRLRRLISNEPLLSERVDVYSMTALATRLYQMHFDAPRMATDAQVRALLAEASTAVPSQRFNSHFLWTEWSTLIDAYQLRTWEEYRDVKRLGRKTRVSEQQRQQLWVIFERTSAALAQRGLMTLAGVFARITESVKAAERPPYDYAVVDEAQDISVAELRFVAAIGGSRNNGLFFAGDLGQRIFRQPFSWKALGVDVRGRSDTLRINYRTSHQIRIRADRLLARTLSDVDGITESREGTVSAFNGAVPEVRVFASPEEERQAVASWIGKRLTQGYRPHEIAIFVRTDLELPRAADAAAGAGADCLILTDAVETKRDHIALSTMHRAKGLEFRAVAVMACDDEVIPLQPRLETAADDSDLQDAYDTERHLLYVACTRARDNLLVTGVEPASEFLDDLNTQGKGTRTAMDRG